MNKLELKRRTTQRLRIIEYAQEHNNIAKACRHYGVSRQNFYKWKKRYEEFGVSGLCDRSKKPNSHPNETPKEVISKILYLRKNYHFGATKLSYYLKRYHQISVSSSTIQKILKKYELNRLPVNKEDMSVLKPAGSVMKSKSLGTVSRLTLSF